MATVQWAAGPSGQGSVQVLEFLFAFLLSGLIGVERQIRQKSAGLRTYTTVGSGAALFTLVSKYGFADVVSAGTVELDPSRMAAQIVSGLGFIGAGVIFVHRGWVQGLTTAATIWLTAAVGSAAAAGLPLLAALTVAAYFLASYAIRPLLNRLPALHRPAVSYRIVYRPGRGCCGTCWTSAPGPDSPSSSCARCPARTGNCPARPPTSPSRSPCRCRGRATPAGSPRRSRPWRAC